MATPIAKAARKPRTRKPDPATVDAIEAALVRLVNPPAVVCVSSRTVGSVDYTVALYSDDTIRIVTDTAPEATGRFVTSTKSTPFGYSVESQIVDVLPVDAVSAEILQSLTNDLTYFAMRAGRFSGGKGA